MAVLAIITSFDTGPQLIWVCLHDYRVILRVSHDLLSALSMGCVLGQVTFSIPATSPASYDPTLVL